MPRPRHRACLLGGVLGRPAGVLGASWGRIGRILGPSWARLGSLGASWERLWRGSAKNPFFIPKFSAPGGRLGASWGASWGRLGRVLGPSWGRLGSLGASWERLGAVLRRLGDVWGRISLPIQLESEL